MSARPSPPPPARPAAAKPAAKAAASKPQPAAALLKRPSYWVPPAKWPWWRLHLLGCAVGVSLGAHGAILAMGFISLPATPQRVEDNKLDIVLVNASHSRKPNKAVVLAQANLDGGGTVDKNVRKTSPLPVENQEQQGDALFEARQRTAELEAQTRELMLQAKNMASVLEAQRSKLGEAKPDQIKTPEGVDLQALSRSISRKAAIVARNQQEYAARPRKGFIATAAEKVAYAMYAEDWRSKVERMGEINYPTALMRGQRLRSVMLGIEIRPDGKVLSITVDRSSGDKKLDAAAQRIVRLASPFAPFSKEMRQNMDILVLTRTFTFGNFALETR